MLSQIGVTWR